MRDRLHILLAVLLVPVLGWIDHVTGTEANFFVFYFGPIALLAWYGGRTAGLIGALACSAVWYLVDQVSGRQYAHVFSGVWNAGIRLTAFAVLATATARIADDRRQKEALNRRLAETVDELQRSLERITALRRDIQTICAWTKRIKSEGRWMQFEEFLERQLQVRVSHGISEEGIAQLKEEMNLTDEDDDADDAPRPV